MSKEQSQHEHLKETEPSTVELYTALPLIIGLEDAKEMMMQEFPFHPDEQSLRENVSPEGKLVEMRVVKLTIEFTGDRIIPENVDGD